MTPKNVRLHEDNINNREKEEDNDLSVRRSIRPRFESLITIHKAFCPKY